MKMQIRRFSWEKDKCFRDNSQFIDQIEALHISLPMKDPIIKLEMVKKAKNIKKRQNSQLQKTKKNLNKASRKLIRRKTKSQTIFSVTFFHD